MIVKMGLSNAGPFYGKTEDTKKSKLLIKTTFRGNALSLTGKNRLIFSYKNKSVTQRTFLNKDFDKTESFQSNFSKSSFENTSFKAAKFKFCSLYEVNFKNCDFVGSLFRGSNLTSATFEGCTIRSTIFEKCKLRNLTFKDCLIVGTKLNSSITIIENCEILTAPPPPKPIRYRITE